MPNIVRRVVCRGSGSDLFMIAIANLLLKIVTLGLYEAWGRTRVRRYLWSAVEFAGERLVYHGTGKELFIGWLKGVLIVLVIMFAGGAVSFAFLTMAGREAARSPLTALPTYVVTFGGFFWLVCIALVGGRRYRMSRTSWRGIRFSFRGSWKQFMPIMVRRALVPFTLGLAYPFVYIQERRFSIANTYFGNQAFTFEGQGRDLFWPWIRTMLLMPLTLGLCWFWFLAERHRYVWAHTRFGGAQFRSTMGGGALLVQWLGNVLLLVVTLGIGMPYVTVRWLTFLTDHLVVIGAVDVDAIVQDAQQASAAGEGVAAALDIDSDLGLAI